MGKPRAFAASLGLWVACTVATVACARTAAPSDKGGKADPKAQTDQKGQMKEALVVGAPKMKQLGEIGPMLARGAPPKGGRRFWVSPSGNDVNDCSEKAPCREISRAASLASAPGDVVLVADGSYRRFTIDGARGEPDKPITIFAVGSKVKVLPDADCNGKNACRDNIILRRSQYLVLDGISSDSAPRAAVAIFYGSHITIRNAIYADNGRWGIFTSFADDVTIERNELKGSRREHGIYVSNSGDRPIIRANLVHDNDGCGIQINADMREKPELDRTGRPLYPAGADGLVTGAVIERNLIYRNGEGKLANKNKRRGAAINLDGVQDSVIEGNLLYENAATGIVAYGDADGLEDDTGEDGDGKSGPKGLKIVRNTVVMPEGARNALLIRFAAGPNVVQNNILLHQDKRRAGIEFGAESDARMVDSDGNVLDRVIVAEKVRTLEDWRKEMGKDRKSRSVQISTLFVNPAAGDFTVKEHALTSSQP